ncbi:MAG: peptidylprolyl isomerase [Acidobacteriota bacterium]
MLRILAGCLTSLLIMEPVLAAGTGGEEKPQDQLHPRVRMSTSKGDIDLVLDAERAPVTVDNFIQYVEDGIYDGTIFHRVMPNFMIQGGGFTADLKKKTEGLRSGIHNEWRNGLKNQRGTIAMARMPRRPDSATAQFFINVVDNTQLDQPADGAGYAVFGRVVAGMDVVDAIQKVQTGNRQAQGPPPGPRRANVPTEPILLKSVKVMGEYDSAQVKEQIEMVAGKEKAARAAAREKSKIQLQNFITSAETESGRKFKTTPSGLMYLTLREGTGPSPTPTDNVQVHYTGWLADGTKFDSSVDRSQPITFPLNSVIKGWTEGVSMMKVGEKARLIIPPQLAYGKAGRPGTIPPRATLVFDVELLGIK